MTELEAAEARLDRWNDGALDGCRANAKRSEDPDYLEGYDYGREIRRVQVVMPERPEGYYHSPLPRA